jgi:hypothetical protein
MRDNQQPTSQRKGLTLSKESLTLQPTFYGPSCISSDYPVPEDQALALSESGLTYMAAPPSRRFEGAVWRTIHLRSEYFY